MGKASAPTAFSARHDSTKLSRVFKSRVDTATLSSTALLSYPEKDLAGDLVNPEGVRFFKHMAHPAVDIEHRRDPDFGDATVGWARDPAGNYAARHVLLKCHDDIARPLPVGTTYFDPSDRLQAQAFALVERGVLPDVSLEFVPDWTAAKAVGWSDLEGRKAYEFGRVDVVRWTLCAKGVCPSATTLKSVYDPLRSVLSAGRIGSEPLHETIKKAFAHKAGKSNTVTVPRTVEKADMNDLETPVPEMPDVPDAEAPADEGADEAPALGGIAAMYAKVEALLASVEQNESDMETSDSPELRAFMEKVRGKISALAEEIKAKADAHDAKLNGEKGEKEEGESEGEESEGESEDSAAPPDMETDDEGALKAVRPRYKPMLKACRKARYSLAEVLKAEREAAERKAAKSKTAQEVEDEALIAKFRKLCR
jgi:hypothetical protein